MKKFHMVFGARAPGSFTLVEVLAATAVLTVLFSIMFSILQQTSKGWQAANRRVEASQAARLALEQIASDLENCVVFIQTNVPIPNRTNTTNFAYGFVHTNEASSVGFLPSEGVTFASPNDYIFVVTPFRSSLRFGSPDLAETGYAPVFVTRSSAGAGYSTVREGRYVLLRSFCLTNSNTFPITDFLTNSLAWETTPRLANQNNTNNFWPFVDNCVRFDIRFLYLQGGVVRTNATWGRPTTNGWVGSPQNVQGLPLAADITLSLVDERTAERIFRLAPSGLSAAQLGRIPDSMDTMPNPNGEALAATLREGVTTLRRRVHFKNAGMVNP